eukprot:SM000088S23712  [mRNA]  locus=s88:228605:228912:- [translate_table: standard]
MECGRCGGAGAYPTKPGLAGVSSKVGMARCKSCFGRKVVPCLICGLPDPDAWTAWQEYAKRWPCSVAGN